MIRRGVAIGLMAVLALTAPAHAHRLDELLQATTVSLEPDRATLELRLTPGVNVADVVLASLDPNSDGVISAGEQQVFTGQVAAGLSAEVDGQPAGLQLAASAFPTPEEVRSGVGNIELTFEAALPGRAGSRTLSIENHYRSDISAYLVNALVPADPVIRINGQHRSFDQATYELNFTTAVEAAAASSGLSQAQLTESDTAATAGSFFWTGIVHILTGYDHLLFIAALVLGAISLWDLVKVATAFTVAHSLTLTLAALHLVSVPSAIVEPIIAASIVFVAAQNLIWPERSHGSSRLIIAFIFGLFHGLGFAGGLLELMNQMPAQTVLLTIVAFSLGIEVGNQVVILPLFGLLRLARAKKTDRRSPDWSAGFRRVGSAAVSIGGAYYLCTALFSGY